jgi:23S rRNA pseudouridine1911/1915/1917 synthase
MKFIVKESDAKKRFDVYLAEVLGVTRSNVQHIIKRNEASINGKPAGGGIRLKAGDEITTLPVDAAELPAEDGLLSITAETKDYLIVEKPAGLTVHATATRTHGTLVNLLLNYFPAIREVGEPHRPGIVHRLDRDVSGLMIAAKTQKAYDYFKKQFAEHKVHKEYCAVVLGTMNADAGTIDEPLGRNRKGKMAVKIDGLPSITHYEVLRRGKKSTLLKIITETGRMHQIRVHLKFISHPIAGDTLYAPTKAGLKPKRLLLHASKIGFVDMGGNEVSYESELPPEFTNIP